MLFMTFKKEKVLLVSLSFIAAIVMLSAALMLLPAQNVDAAPLNQDSTRSNITVTVLTRNDSTAETLNAVDGDGNKFYNNGKTWIQIVNDYTATITATFVTPGQIFGLDIEDKDIAVSSGGTVFAGPFHTAYFNQNSGTDSGYTYINYNSAVTGTVVNSVTVGAYRLP